MTYSFYSDNEGELYIDCYYNADPNRRYEIYIKDYIMVSYKEFNYNDKLNKDCCTSIDIEFKSDIKRVIPIA